MRQTVNLNHASRLLNHGPTVLVSTRHGNRRNVMAASWSMPVEFTPPRIAVVIDKSTFTKELLLASGQFALSLPGAALADITYTVGSVSGRDMADGTDKFERYGIRHFPGPELGLPLIEGAVAWLECRRLPELHTEAAYDTVFAEVVSAQADARVFTAGRWNFDPAHAELHPLHHLGAGQFAWPREVVVGRRLG